MKKLLFSAMVLTLLVLAGNAPVDAKTGDTGDQIFAFLRKNSKEGMIEIYINRGLELEEAVEVSFYKRDGSISRFFNKKDDIRRCPLNIQTGDVCYSELSKNFTKITYKFSMEIKPQDEFLISLSISHQKDGVKTTENPVIFGVYKDFIETVAAVEKFYSMDGFNILPEDKKPSFEPNGVITLTFNYSKPDDMPENIYRQYLEARLKEIYTFESTHSSQQKSFADVKVETLTGGKIDFTTVPYSIKITPQLRDAVVGDSVIISLVIDKKLPMWKSLVELQLKDSPPIELAEKLHTEPFELKTPAAPDAKKVSDDKSLGLREFKNNLDLGLAFVSSIKDKKDDAGISIRKRENKGYLDLRFAPLRNRPFNRRKPTWYYTPFFIDAKISNDKLKEDSLSLNRILLGTEFSYRQLNSETHNKYIYTFRGINASDRDFKRVEGKFNFEFRPIWRKLNRPLTNQFDVSVSSIDSKQVRVNTKNQFGWQIQPYAGFEVGRVYHSKRDFFDNEEKTLNLRRLIFGTDTVFNITRYVNLKLSDVFYVRGESSEARLRNYFSGELQAPIIRSGDTAQHLFVSFEKGDQPPFVTRAVNSFKIGYRVTTNWFGQTAAP